MKKILEDYMETKISDSTYFVVSESMQEKYTGEDNWDRDVVV